MTDPDLLRRIVHHGIAAAEATHEIIPIEPFRLLIHRSSDAVWENVAVALESTSDVAAVGEAIFQAERIFGRRRRIARFEFFPALQPGLADQLAAEGYDRQADRSVLVRSAAEAPSGRISAFEVRQLTAESPAADLVAGLTVRREALEVTPVLPPPDEQVAFREALRGRQRAALALIDGRPAGVAIAQMDGDLAEMAGLATRSEFRRQGVATALAGALIGHLWDQGAAWVWTAAPDDAAIRLARRLGFRPVGTRISYITPT